jgi:hypothetical protein
MADDPRALLAGLPVESMLLTPPGQVAILRTRAEETGADMEALDSWVIKNGGRIRKAPPIQSSGLRAGRVTARTEPGQAYYVLPSAVLAAEKS